MSRFWAFLFSVKMLATDPLTLPEYHAFRGAFGRLCLLSAFALQRNGVPRTVVSRSFRGEGTDARTRGIRLQRVCVNHTLEKLRYAFAKHGIIGPDAARLIVQGAREARDAVQGEWAVSIPIVDPNP